jgi:hypothetical protein
MPHRHWTDFPDSIVETLARFRRDGEVSIGPSTPNAARGARMELYRFRDAVTRAVRTSVGADTAAVEMQNLLWTMLTVTEPAGRGMVLLKIIRNPMEPAAAAPPPPVAVAPQP